MNNGNERNVLFCGVVIKCLSLSTMFTIKYGSFNQTQNQNQKPVLI